MNVEDRINTISALCLTLQSMANQFGSKSYLETEDKLWQAIKSSDRITIGDLIGRLVRFPVDRGYAYYIVRSVKQRKTCNLFHVSYMDDLKSDMVSSKGECDYATVERYIDFENDIQKHLSEAYSKTAREIIRIKTLKKCF